MTTIATVSALRWRYVSITLPDLVHVGERTRIQLCGRLSVELDGVELVGSLRGKQVPLLLAYLVLNRDRPVGRDELIDALWPEQAPRSQDAAMRTLLSRLRSALGSDVLAGRDELGLELPEPAWVDVEAAASEVARAQRALDGNDARAAWALAQVPLNIASRGLLPGTQATWLEPRRRELADVRLQALEVIGRAGLSLGGTQVASVERAARDPDRDRALPGVRLRAPDGRAGGPGQRRRGTAGVRAAAVAAARRTRREPVARGDCDPRTAAAPGWHARRRCHRARSGGHDRGAGGAGGGRLGPARRPPRGDGAPGALVA